VSQFKTMKYQSEFPASFGSLMEGRSFSQRFFSQYNMEHHHSAPAYLTPEVVHNGLAGQVLSKRQSVLDEAYQAHPERFVNGQPSHPSPPEAAWINPPSNMTLH
jgi:putative transposase